MLARECAAEPLRRLDRRERAGRPGRRTFAATAKSVIWCFLDGGPSHIDLFDPKPELTKLAGQPLPDSFERPITAMGTTAYTPLLASQAQVSSSTASRACGSATGIRRSPSCADDLAVIRSCYADGLNHVGGVCQMNTGSVLGGRPSLGSWCLYGLGSECDDLPGYVVLTDTGDDPPGGNRNWGTGFMPAAYQGTQASRRQAADPARRPGRWLAGRGSAAKLDFIQQLNRRHQQSREDDSRLEARIASYELAFRMQAAAPEAIDLVERDGRHARVVRARSESRPRNNGRNCLLARRLVERGVRFVQLYMGSGSKWDAHTDVEGNHSPHCRESDRPIAGLLTDLKQRGLLDTTLVVWGGEFGRTPMSESGNGRDHNPYGFTIWMAGGGVKGRRHATARPTKSACTPSKTRCTSTTFTPRSCTCWASTTNS